MEELEGKVDQGVFTLVDVRFVSSHGIGLP
jgi:hypothetical protein